MSDTAKKPRRKVAQKKTSKSAASAQAVVKNIVSAAVAGADVTNAQLIARRNAAFASGVASAAAIYSQ